MTLIYVFPGQGSQAVGMGGDLFDRYPDLTRQASELLGYSIRELCLEDPEKRLVQTEYTQPALYVVNALTCLARREETGREPDYLAGHSLGEYDALYAAGVFDFATGLRLVQKRGELMAKVRGGGMAAVIGIPAEKVIEILRNSGCDSVDVANDNSPVQTVLSGPDEDVVRVMPKFKESGARAIKLRVSGAFHSRMMKPVEDEFRQTIAGISFGPPRIPVVANATALPYDPEAIAETLASQISRPVRWTETIRFLLGQPEPEFHELGPGTVLTKLIAQIRKHESG